MSGHAKANTIVIALILAGAMSAHARVALHLATESTIKYLDGCVHTFGLVHGRFPTSGEGVSALVTAPVDIANTNMFPYIKTIPNDPWERDYVYRFPAGHNRQGPDIYSLGEDGISKTGGNDPDDINNWNTNRPWASHYSKSVPSGFGLALLLVGGIVIGIYIFGCWRNPLPERPTSNS